MAHTNKAWNSIVDGRRYQCTQKRLQKIIIVVEKMRNDKLGRKEALFEEKGMD